MELIGQISSVWTTDELRSIANTLRNGTEAHNTTRGQLQVQFSFNTTGSNAEISNTWTEMTRHGHKGIGRFLCNTGKLQLQIRAIAVLLRFEFFFLVCFLCKNTLMSTEGFILKSPRSFVLSCSKPDIWQKNYWWTSPQKSATVKRQINDSWFVVIGLSFAKSRLVAFSDVRERSGDTSFGFFLSYILTRMVFWKKKMIGVGHAFQRNVNGNVVWVQGCVWLRSVFPCVCVVCGREIDRQTEREREILCILLFIYLFIFALPVWWGQHQTVKYSLRHIAFCVLNLRFPKLYIACRDEDTKLQGLFWKGEQAFRFRWAWTYLHSERDVIMKGPFHLAMETYWVVFSAIWQKNCWLNSVSKELRKHSYHIV